MKIENDEMRSGLLTLLSEDECLIQSDMGRKFKGPVDNFYIEYAKDLEIIKAAKVVEGNTFYGLTAYGHDIACAIKSDDFWKSAKQNYCKMGQDVPFMELVKACLKLMPDIAQDIPF